MSKLEWDQTIQNTIIRKIEKLRKVDDLDPEGNKNERISKWFLFGTDSPLGKQNRSKKVKIFQEGETYEKLHEIFQNGTNQIYFAMIRVYMLDLYKFILVSWCGPDVSRIVKGQCFNFLNNIKDVVDFKHCVTHVGANEKDIQKGEVWDKIKKMCGSQYMGGITK